MLAVLAHVKGKPRSQTELHQVMLQMLRAKVVPSFRGHHTEAVVVPAVEVLRSLRSYLVNVVDQALALDLQYTFIRHHEVRCRSRVLRVRAYHDRLQQAP